MTRLLDNFQHEYVDFNIPITAKIRYKCSMLSTDIEILDID